MSTNKKFRIQNGVDVTGELTVNDVVIIRADGTIVAGAIADAVSSLVDEGALTGSGSSIVDSDSQIFIDVNSNTVAIASETATRISDIANLQSQINSLGVNSDTQAEIDSLQSQINAIIGTSPETLDTLVEIVSAFEGADSDIQSLLTTNSSLLSANTTQISGVADDLTVETTRRIAGDNALQNSLNAEIARATTADDLNAAAISAEAIARQTDVASLQASQFTYNDSDGWTGNLIPSADNQYALGSPDRVWKDLYIGPGSLYINGTKILEDNSGTITMYADAGQNLSFGATGGGNIDLNAGDESIQLKSDLVMSVGETISTVGGEPTKFGGAVDMGTHKIKNVGAPVDASDAATKEYVDSLEAQGTISGDKVFEDNVTIQGNLSVEGTTTTLDTQTLTVADNIIDLNSNVSTGVPTLNAGIRIMRGDEPAVQLRWNELEDRWEVYDGVTATPIAVTSTDVIAEGDDKLFFTVVRAREAVSQDIADAVAAEATARGAAIDAEIARATSAEQANAAAIVAEKTARENADSDESVARIAGDATVQAAVDAEQAARIAADLSEAQTRAAAITDLQSQLNTVTGSDLSSIQSQLDAIVGTSPETLDTIQEVVAAFEGADSDLTSLITGNSSTIAAVNASLTQEVANRTFFDTAEATARENADDALQAAVDAETARATAAEQANASAISTETAARIAGDTDEAALRVAGDAAEATARVAGDATVQAAVDAEVARATAAEQANASAISAEETRALAAEASLQSKIDQVEAGGAQHPLFSTLADLPDASANHGMFAHVHAEGAAYFAHAGQWIRLANLSDLDGVDLSSIQSQIDNIVGTSPANLDTLQEIVSLFENADSDLQTLLTTNSSAIASIQSDVTDLQAAVSDTSGADAALQQEVDARIAAVSSEATARIAGDADLASDILEEKTQRIAQASIETTARISADNALDAKIDAEESARLAGDASLQAFINTQSSNLSDETTQRIGADGLLQNQIDDIVADNAARTASGATVAELNAVEDALDAEVVRAQLAEQANASAIVTGDAALQAQLDAIIGTSPETLDTLQEIVSAYESADNSLRNLVDTNTGTLAALQTTIGAENVPLITPDIGETITYEVEYAGRQFYAVSDTRNVYVYDSARSNPRIPVATIYNNGETVERLDANSEAVFVRWSSNQHAVYRYEFANLVLGITSSSKQYHAANNQSISAFAVSEDYIYVHETSGTDQIWRQPLSESGTTGSAETYTLDSINGYRMRVFGDKLYALRTSGTDTLWVWDINAVDGSLSNAHQLTSSDLNSDTILWGSGETTGAFEASSTLIAVGAPGDDTQGPEQGSVYLFNPDNLNEAHTKLYLPPEYASSSHQFGYSIALTDTRLIVGALSPSSGSTTEQGRIFIYDSTNLILPPLVVEAPDALGHGWFPYAMHEESNRLIVRPSHEDYGLFVYDLTNMDQDPLNLIEPANNNASGTFGSLMAITPAATVTQSITDTIIPAQGLGNSINYLESQRQKLRADLEANLAAIQSNDADITAIAADVATNTANIATNAAAIVAVNADRTTFEASVTADRQSHRDAVQADIDAFTTTVNASQAQFISDHDSDYTSFTSSVESAFATTNELQDEIRTRMGVGHVALPQETTSITYDRQIPDQYYMVRRGDNETYVYTSANWTSTGQNVGVGTRIEFPDEYTTDGATNSMIVTRDHAIFLVNKANTSGEHSFLVYDLETINVASTPIAVVDCGGFDRNLEYDGSTKLMVTKWQNNSGSSLGGVRVYDIPSLAAGNAIYVESMVDDLPSSLGITASDPSNVYVAYGNLADWNSTHVFVASEAQQKVIVYNKSDLSYVTALSDTVYNGPEFGDISVRASDTMVAVTTRQGDTHWSNGYGKVAVFDATDLSVPPVIITDNNLIRHYSNSHPDNYYYYAFRSQDQIAVHDDYLFLGNIGHSSSGTNGRIFIVPKAIALQGDSVLPQNGTNSAGLISWSDTTWGHLGNDTDCRYSHEISVHGDLFVVNAHAYRQHSFNNTNLTMIHDINDLTLAPVKVEEIDDGTNQYAHTYVSPRATITESYTETFNPNDSLTSAVNYLNAKKEELLTAVGALTGSTSFVEDVQAIEANIDFKLAAQDQRFDSDKAEQVAIYAQANLDQSAVYAAANAEQRSIYDSANAAHVAYFEQYTDGETAARESADTTLQTNIDTEESARIAGDSDLQSQIDAILGASPAHLDTMVEIVSAFENADSDISNLLSTNATNNAVNATAISALESSVEAIASATEVDLDAKVPFVFVKKPEANTVLAYNGNNLNLSPIELTPNRESGETVDADMGYGVDVAVSSTKVVVAASNGEFFVYDATDLFSAPTIINSGVTSGDFGSSIVMTDNVIAISSVSDGSYGTVKLYDASSYALLSTLEPSAGTAGMGYGQSMAIRGSTLVVSSPKQKMTMESTTSVGFLYVYDVTNPSSSSLVATLRGPNSDVGIIGGSVTMNDRWIATSLTDKAVVWDRLNLSESPKVFSTGGLESGLTQGGMWGAKRSGQSGWSTGIDMPLSNASLYTNQINLGDEGDYYSYQFVGYFKAPETANFTFRINSDNQGLMWIGESALMLTSERSHNQSIIYQTNVGTDTATVSMIEGEMYPILLSFTENVAGAWFQFTWQGGAQTSYTYDLTQHFYYNPDEADFSPAHIPVNSIEPIILEDNKMYVGSYNGVSIWNDISTVNTTDYTDWKQAVAADSHIVAPNNEDEFGIAIGLMSGFLFVGSNSQSISVFEVANLDNPPNVKLIDSVSNNIESVPSELAPPVAEGLLTAADSTIGAINEVHNELDAEVARATGVESVLRTDIDANTATINANIVDISNETSARISGDSVLQAQIDNIVGTSPETLDTIQEVVSAFQNADNDIQTLISNNSTEILSLQNEIGGGSGLTNLPNVMTEITRTVYQDQYMIVSGNANGGSVYVFDANNPSEQPVKLTHPGGATNASFGSSVCVAREYLVVGARYDDEVSTSQGAVFVYELADLTIPPVRLQPNTTTETHMNFGTDVVGTDEFIIVGCPGDDYTGGQGETNSGSVYLFDINNFASSPTVLEPTNDQLEQEGWSGATSNDDNHWFGYRLEVIDNVLFVGSKNYAYLSYAYAQRYSGSPNYHTSRDHTGNVGQISTYDLTNLLNAGSNVSATHNDALNYQDANYYGNSYQVESLSRGFGQYGIAMSSSHLFVGMPDDDYNPAWTDSTQVDTYRGMNNGLIAIFPRSGTYGINDSVRFIKSPEYEGNQKFGWSLAVDETYLYVGVPYDNNAYGINAGQVLVYELEDLYDNATQNGSSAPTPAFTLNAPDGAAEDYFGFKVSVNGGKLAVAAPYDDDQGSGSGAVYIYQTNLLSGVPIKITPSDLVDQDTLSTESIFGYSSLNLTVASGAVEISDHVLPNSGISTGMNYLMHRTNELEKLANDVNINAYNYANNISIAQEGYGIGIADNAAAIATETTARADGDAAQQVEIDGLTATTTSLTTQLNNEIARSISEDSDLNHRVNLLSSALQPDSDGDIIVEGLATFSDGISVGSSGGAIGHDPSSNAITIMSDLDMNEQQVLNIAEPTVDKDVTTKLYVDTQVSTEETRATAVETNLQSQIDHIVGTSPETLDTFQEIVATLQGSDSDLLALMTSNATGVGGLNASLTTETANRESADTVLQSNIDTEESARIAGDSDLQSQIDSNDTDISNLDSDVGAVSSLSTTATTVVSAINEVHSELDVEVARATAAESAETTRATAAESVLQSNINTESSARIAGDASLQSQIDTLSGTQTSDKSGLEVSIAAETARATGAENTLQSNIDAEATRAQTAEAANAAAVVTEQARAEAVEAGLAADIAVETARATAAEVQLANHLGANFTDGSITVDGLATFNGGLYFGDGTGTIGFNADVDNLQVLSNLDLMGNRIINYPTPVDSGDVTTKGYVDSTTQAVSDRVDAILQGAGESLDTIVEVVAAFENADSDIQSLITSNSTSVTANTNAIAAEVADRQQAITDESTARRNADSDLSAGLSNETSRALSAEGVLTSDLAAEVARATSAETGLAADIAAEASRATAAEGVNATAISAETTRATTVEASLAQDIADEALRAQGAEAVLTSDVSTNATAISNLQSQVAGVSTSSGSSTIEMTAEVDMKSNKITGMADPTAAQDAATKSYVDASVATEATARTTEDTSLQSNIDAANARIDAILNGSVESLDTVVEVVSAFEGADSDIQNLITANASTISQNATAITNEATARANADSDEAALRTAADAVLTADLAAEVARATAAETAESTARVAADSDLTDNLAAEVARATAAETAESTARANADSDLTVDLAAEVARATAAETAEAAARVAADSDLTVSLVAETSRATTAESGLQSNIDAEELRATTAEGVLTTNLANEISRATSAEAGLASDISAEETRALAAEAAEASARADADSDLQSAVDAEVARATAAESVNAQAVADEATARTSADTTLQSNIDTVSGRVDAILNGSSESLDTIVEVVAAFENADSDLQTLISSNAGSHTANAAAIVAEETRALAAEGVLQSAIDAEETRATGVESSLQSQITSEIAARSAADQSMKDELDSDIAAEAALRAAGDASLQSGLDVEVARATAAEGVLQSLLDSEQSARILSDQGLQSAITAEENARVAADAVLQSAIDAEELARTSADNTLQANIDAVDAAVTAITNGSPETLNQLVEVVAAFEDADSDIQTLISNLGGDASALTARVSTLEGEMDATELATTSNANAISAETAARVAAVQVNADAIAAESTARAAAITAEQNARAAAIAASESDRDSADADLQAQITALSTTEQSSKSSLQALLSQEVADRTAGDSDLTDSLAAEVARATAAESALSTDISDEASARATADASLQTQIDSILSNTDATALNSLAEIVTEFQSVDGTLTGLISSNGSRISALESSVGTIEGWTTDNLSEGSINKYWTEQRTKDCLTGGLCISYNSTTGEISIDEAEAATELTVAEAHDANALDGQAPSYYRINVYDAAGNLVN